jgi:hypothetical protein
LTLLFRYTDPQIGNYYLSDLSLNIALSGERIFFSICSIKTKKILAVGHYIFSKNSENINDLIDNLSKLQASEKILSPTLSYKNVRYTVLNYEATLIPKKYFNEKEKEKYLELLFPKSNNRTIYVEKIPQIKAITVSGISPVYPAAISIPYANVEYKSVYSTLIEKIFNISEEKKYHRFPVTVLLHITDNAFELIVKKSTKLILANTFPYKRKSDILYYFLYTLNKLGLDMGAIAVFLCGKAREMNLLPEIKMHAYHSTYYKTKNDTIDEDIFLLTT